ncbi:MAG: TIGR04283 family arsenosugar biosynthesis glycosyltransferase [Salinisphaera sp.]|jgi:rSAM/selenodomain-associated transferase 2|nr:TIGR04283 family arsenosugar biosynthesis glycosyltransferase [Salinisphaera sp.]
MRPRLSVIVPVIDESPALSVLLAQLRAQQDVALQIIVADGGSQDDSRDVAEQANALWVSTTPGRARQMNAGAVRATGTWLCFLHADSQFTRHDQLRRAVDCLSAVRRPVAGHWPLRFERRDTAHGFFYRFMQAKTATGRCYTINGDQGVLIPAAYFRELGGYDERLQFLEDQRLAHRIAETGDWQLLPDRLTTSARRFEREGALARYLLMALLMAMYIADVSMFFERAPGVYARQRDTARLALMPYFRLLRALMRNCGFRSSAVVCWRIAGIAMRELWQCVFVLDVVFGSREGDPRGRLATGYGRYVARWIEQPVTQGLLLVLLFVVLFGPIQWFFAWRERPDMTLRR